MTPSAVYTSRCIDDAQASTLMIDQSQPGRLPAKPGRAVVRSIEPPEAARPSASIADAFAPAALRASLAWG
jgi:hypothetical protein